MDNQNQPMAPAPVPGTVPAPGINPGTIMNAPTAPVPTPTSVPNPAAENTDATANSMKTNKKIVLDKEPIAPPPTPGPMPPFMGMGENKPEEPEEPKVQSGNITF